MVTDEVREGFSHEWQMRDELMALAPAFSIGFSGFLQSLSVLTSAVFRQQTGPLALVTNHVLNDFVDMLRHATAGDGRAALRTARSLFEGVITLEDLYNDVQLQERYGDHEAVTLESLVDLDWGYERLDGKQRRSANHYKRKAERRHRGATERLVAKYGPGIRRGWHPHIFRDRVDALGFGEDYDFYRLTSALLHSSSGGALGVLGEVDGTRVHRTGPAVSLCPLAVLHGLRHMRHGLGVFEVNGVPIPQSSISALDSLEAAWPEFFTACAAIDRAMWPEDLPRGTAGVLLLEAPAGMGSRWLVANASVEFAEAFEPNLSDRESLRLVEIVDEIESLTAFRTEPVAIAVSFAYPLPKPGSRWRNMFPLWGGGPHYIADLDKIVVRDPPHKSRRPQR